MKLQSCRVCDAVTGTVFVGYQVLPISEYVVVLPLILVNISVELSTPQLIPVGIVILLVSVYRISIIANL